MNKLETGYKCVNEQYSALEIKVVAIFIIAVITFTGCDKSLNVKSDIHNKQVQTASTEKDNLIKEKENLNPFFFKDISHQKQYIYKGTAWGYNIIDWVDNIDGNKPEDMDEF